MAQRTFLVSGFWCRLWGLGCAAILYPLLIANMQRYLLSLTLETSVDSYR